MKGKTPRPPGKGGMINDPADPTQAMPDTEGLSDEDRTILEQQHTGNHQKPDQEGHGADRRGGTRTGAKNVERTGKRDGG